MTTLKSALAVSVLAVALAAPITPAQAGGYGYGRLHDVATDFVATFLGRAAVDELVSLGEHIGTIASKV